jgi:hypothetical protein
MTQFNLYHENDAAGLWPIRDDPLLAFINHVLVTPEGPAKEEGHRLLDRLMGNSAAKTNAYLKSVLTPPIATRLRPDLLLAWKNRIHAMPEGPEKEEAQAFFNKM